MQPLVRSLLFQSLAEDLASFLDLPQVNCSKKAWNVSSYVIDWVGLYAVDRVSDVSHRDTTVLIDIDVLDPDPSVAKAAASCIVNALQTQRQAYLTFPNASRVAAALTTNGVQDLAANPNYFFGTGGGTILLSPALNYSLQNPCDPKWCATLAPIVDPAAPPEDHTAAIVGGVVAAVLLLAAVLAAYFLWWRPRRAFAAGHMVRDERDVDYRRLRDVDALELTLMENEDASTTGQSIRKGTEKEFHMEGDEMASVRMFVH